MKNRAAVTYRSLVAAATAFLVIISATHAFHSTCATRTAHSIRTTGTSLRLSSDVTVDTSQASDASESSSAVVDKFVKPPRLIPEDPSLIPTLYNYDHCPFCVRVRLALGFKNIKHNLIFLANDDVHTPTALVGKKIAPIMRFPNADDDDLIMKESMDIIEFIEMMKGLVLRMCCVLRLDAPTLRNGRTA